jgi:hypothetical protein
MRTVLPPSPDHPGALAFRRSSSRLVSRNGARWLRTKVCSSASAVTCRCAPEPTQVVDQHLQPRVCVEYLAGQAPDFGLGGQVGCEHVHHRVARGRADVGRCGLGADLVAAVMPTRAPRAARPAAMALPMPSVPPVTATFSQPSTISLLGRSGGRASAPTRLDRPVRGRRLGRERPADRARKTSRGASR